jgi:hypothetical protein
MPLSKTRVGRVFDLLDNRMFRLFKQFEFRNRWVRGFFLGRKTRTHSEIKATARSGYFKTHQVAGKNQRRTGSFFFWSAPQIV